MEEGEEEEEDKSPYFVECFHRDCIEVQAPVQLVVDCTEEVESHPGSNLEILVEAGRQTRQLRR